MTNPDQVNVVIGKTGMLRSCRHPCFRRGHEFLLEKIKRNVSKPKAVQFAPAMKSEKINEVVNEVNNLKDKQVDLDGKLETMRLENEALWKEVRKRTVQYVHQDEDI